MHRINMMSAEERKIAHVKSALCISTDEAAKITVMEILPNGKEFVQTLFYSGARYVKPGATIIDYAPLQDTHGGVTTLGECPEPFATEFKELQARYKAIAEQKQ